MALPGSFWLSDGASSGFAHPHWRISRILFARWFAAIPLPSESASIFGRSATVQNRLSFYFGWGCQPRAHCLVQLMITMPFYASVAYSLGALVARKAQPKALKNRSGMEEMALRPG